MSQLYVRGVNVDWRAFDKDLVRGRVRVPTYPFERQHYWAPAGKVSGASTRSRGAHPLVGRRRPSPFITDRIFDAELSLESLGWATDHRVAGIPVVPASALLDAAWVAATNLHGDAVDSLERIDLSAPLTFADDASVTLQIAVAPVVDQQATLRIASATIEMDDASPAWRTHAIGALLLRGGPRGRKVDALTDKIDGVAMQVRRGNPRGVEQNGCRHDGNARHAMMIRCPAERLELRIEDPIGDERRRNATTAPRERVDAPDTLPAGANSNACRLAQVPAQRPYRTRSIDVRAHLCDLANSVVEHVATQELASPRCRKHPRYGNPACVAAGRSR